MYIFSEVNGEWIEDAILFASDGGVEDYLMKRIMIRKISLILLEMKNNNTINLKNSLLNRAMYFIALFIFFYNFSYAQINDIRAAWPKARDALKHTSCNVNSVHGLISHI